jgi:serine-type D-Ala-D-Ala carboxypeptidase/endopeptidase (penicillin-binding protein 4)
MLYYFTQQILMRLLIVILFCGVVATGKAQTIQQQLNSAIQAFEKDVQMKHALVSLYVVETKTGNTVFAIHEQLGLAPASTQKIFTSIAAFDLLGSNYQFSTTISYKGVLAASILKGDLVITAGGDPTLGSGRWPTTKPQAVFENILAALHKANIKTIEGCIIIDESRFSKQIIPDGWVWQDVGNYYGAGAAGFNWRENQVTVQLSTGSNLNSKAAIKNVDSAKPEDIHNELSAAEKSSGDNAYMYLPVGNKPALLKGTVPVNENNFEIAVTDVNAKENFIKACTNFLAANKIEVTGKKNKGVVAAKPIVILSSPILDSINFYFLRKSINLYGEALIKIFALQKNNIADTQEGVMVLKNFWKEKGIEPSALNIIDGSGLSPQNRVTTNALVTALQYATTNKWYKSFYESLPTYNNMKMKSGSIGGARSFAGYHTANNGTQYTYAIIVNNYDGSSSAIIKKIYVILDHLK